MTMTNPISPLAAQWDATSIDELVARGSAKWSLEPGVIGAWVAEMDFGTAPSVIEAWRTSERRLEFGYPPAALAADMSAATAQWYSSHYGWDVDPEDISPIADVIKGLELAIVEFTAPGGAVIVPTPAYMPFLFVPPALGREVIQVPMLTDENGLLVLDLETMATHLDGGANLIILANPGNPTGRVYTAAELTALANLADAHDARIFSDEIHAPLTLFGNRHIPLASVSDAAARVSITATSVSKAFNLPGLKCAQIILSADADREKWKTIGFMASHGASTPGIRANTAAYKDGAPWLDEVTRYLESNYLILKDALAAQLPDAKLLPLQGTYLTWVDFSAYEVAGEVGEVLLEKANVKLNSGPAFGEGYNGFVRLNIATPRPVLETIVDRITQALTA
ncbi:MalY/PatB family protein [Salinibacterium sp. NG22]|uniref:MalY/PatB family protein n=1 Tax=Salinibacterium sp. NG22 TaxID=2792040 RepID=UPI001E453DCC|nr:aminotransferase class I/II-fold pyridoxal phosphate-dependent enzyme [Salinibacterium sp. NG22]